MAESRHQMVEMAVYYTTAMLPWVLSGCSSGRQGRTMGFMVTVLAENESLLLLLVDCYCLVGIVGTPIGIYGRYGKTDPIDLNGPSP